MAKTLGTYALAAAIAATALGGCAEHSMQGRQMAGGSGDLSNGVSMLFSA